MRNTRFLWLILGLASFLVAFTPLPISDANPVERVFRVEASSYEFNPSVIKVNPGDIVTIELVSTDVVHGLYIDNYGVSITADPGQTASLTFIADKSGSFRMRCSITCGALHPFMIGKIIVGTNHLLYRGVGLSILAVMAGLLVFRKRSN